MDLLREGIDVVMRLGGKLIVLLGAFCGVDGMPGLAWFLFFFVVYLAHEEEMQSAVLFFSDVGFRHQSCAVRVERDEVAQKVPALFHVSTS